MVSSYIDKGTLITLEDGSNVAIEDLKAGDKVQSYEMSDEDFDMSHIGNSEQIAVSVVDVITETIQGEDVYKLSLSNGSTLSIAGSTDVYSADPDGGILELENEPHFSPDSDPETVSKDTGPGRKELGVGDLLYIDSGEMLEDVVVEGIDKWARSREMCSIWIEGGSSVFANEVMVSANRRLTEKEEEIVEAARIEAEKKDAEAAAE